MNFLQRKVYGNVTISNLLTTLNRYPEYIVKPDLPYQWLNNCIKSKVVKVNVSLNLPYLVLIEIAAQLFQERFYIANIPEDLYYAIQSQIFLKKNAKPADLTKELNKVFIERKVDVSLWTLTALGQQLPLDNYYPVTKHHRVGSSKKKVISFIPIGTKYCYGIDIVEMPINHLVTAEFYHHAAVLIDRPFGDDDNVIDYGKILIKVGKENQKLKSPMDRETLIKSAEIRFMRTLAELLANSLFFSINYRCECGKPKHATFYTAFRRSYSPGDLEIVG
jgi:hypothetical protein